MSRPGHRSGISLGIAVIGGVLLAGAPALAHLGHVVMRAERYLKIDVDDRQARIVVSLTLAADEAVRVLRAADADGDGKVMRAEADAYLQRWGKGLETDLPIHVDGEPVEVQWGEGYLDPLGPIRRIPGTVEMVARVPLDGGTHRVTVHDRMRVEQYDRTDVAFRAREGSELVASGMGTSPRERTEELAYGRRLAGRSGTNALTAVVRVPGMSPTERWLLGAGVGALVLGGVVAWLGLRRRARRARAHHETHDDT